MCAQSGELHAHGLVLAAQTGVVVLELTHGIGMCVRSRRRKRRLIGVGVEAVCVDEGLEALDICLELDEV